MNLFTRLIGLGPRDNVTVYTAGNKYRLHKDGTVSVNKGAPCPWADLPEICQQDLIEKSFVVAIKGANKHHDFPSHMERELEGLVRSTVEHPNKEETFNRVFSTLKR